MKINEILNNLNNFAPWESASHWDNVGLLIGRVDRDVAKAVVCLDIDETVVDLAVEVGANLIVSHHPLFISPLKSIRNELYLRIIENKINVICAHTNLDIAEKGINYRLANLLELTEISHISETEEFGLIGKIPETAIADFAEFVKERLQAPFVKLYALQDKVRTVAVCGGNGSHLLPLLEGKADILVSADFKYHQIIDSKISILDVGHYWSERVAIEILQTELNKMNIECFVPDRHKIQQLEVI